MTRSAVDSGLHGERVYGAGLLGELLLVPAPAVEAPAPLSVVRERLLRLPLQQTRRAARVRDSRCGARVQRVFSLVGEWEVREA